MAPVHKFEPNDTLFLPQGGIPYVSELNSAGENIPVEANDSVGLVIT